ncbi:bifunctional P-type ATPase [Babesia duncani]|uniref:Phospholipid-transporting ATPase n=1 Tax=Babesia duncani TaxID=323732 RepID=A0AAD9PKD8_9APIC|nr:bifunctional P-type ATPase [Babesia duncani]
MKLFKRFFIKQNNPNVDEGKVYLITNYNKYEGTMFEPNYLPPEETFWSRFVAWWIHLWTLITNLCSCMRSSVNKTQGDAASERNRYDFLRGVRPCNVIKTSKYTLLSFLPRVLFFQMTRVANLFFIAISFLQLNLEVSDSNGIPTYIIPVVFVLIVCLARDMVEDLARWRCDEEENSRPVKVFRNGKLQDLKLRDICLGDIVKVHAYEYFPSDLVLLNCSDEQGVCNIETKNADGESNVKYKYVNQELAKLIKNDEDAARIQIKIICEPPSDSLHSFHGNAYFSSEPICDLQKRRLTAYRELRSTRKVSSFEQDAPVNIKFNTVTLSMDQLLLRGTSMVNTEWAYCVAVYVGQKTRLLKGSISESRRKLSKLERLYQRILIIVVAIMSLCVVFCAIGSVIWTLVESEKHGYLNLVKSGSATYTFLVTVGSCLLLLSAMIPVDLIMIWEFVRVFQGRQISWSNDMISSVDGSRAVSKSDHLVEELGNVTHIYSDKTGTLTQNKMELVQLGFGQLGSFNSGNLINGFKEMCKTEDKDTFELLRKFMLVVAVCHSVVLRSKDESNSSDSGDSNTSTPKSSSPPTSRVLKSVNGVARLSMVEHVEECQYDAASPDELALVQFSQAVGCIFTSRPRLTEIELTLTTPEMQRLLLTRDELELVRCNMESNLFPAIRIVIKDVLQFDSDRKRMSVVIEDPQGDILCLSKGADSAMLVPVCDWQILMIDELRKQLSESANEGLRTLIFGCRPLPLSEYEKWHDGYLSAMQLSSNRQEQVSRWIYEIERNYEILCTSGIEDRLQEQVTEVLRDLQLAGIVVWVITGDKLETVLSISRSTGLLTEDVCNAIIDHTDPKKMEKVLKEHIENCKRGLQLMHNSDWRSMSIKTRMLTPPSTKVSLAPRSMSATTLLPEANKYDKFAVTVTGEALDVIYSSEELKQCFFRLAKYASTVIACRVTHKQKAQLVSDNSKYNLNSTSLAIGDGANDVGMILAADVGVGIMGKEGMQASRSADFAIGEFRILRELLFVHGREALRKNMFLLYFCVFRNFSFSFMNVVYGFFCGFSGVSVFNTWSKQIINLCFTSFPLTVFAIMDRQLPFWVLRRYPSLYSSRTLRPINKLIRRILKPISDAWFLEPSGIHDPLDFWGFMICGLWLSIFETILLLKTCGSTFYSLFDGSALHFNFGMFSHVIYVHHVLAVNGIVCFMTNIWFWQSHVLLWLETISLIIMWGASSVIQAFTTVPEAHIFYGSFETMHATIVPILAILISLVVTLSPFWGLLYYSAIFNPPCEQKISLQLKRGEFTGIEANSRPSVSYIVKEPIASTTVDRGFCFSADTREMPLDVFYKYL